MVAAPALRGSSPTCEEARRETGRNMLAVVAFCPLLFRLRAPASSATPTSSLQAGQSSAPKQLAMNVAESRCSYFVAIQTLAALATIIISTPPGGGAGAAALAHPTPPCPLCACLRAPPIATAMYATTTAASAAVAALATAYYHAVS